MFEEYPNDFHAGWIETSNMLDINEDLVRSKYKDQENVEIEPQSMIDSNKINNSIAGNGHIGYPKIATKELGGLLNENMSNKLFEAVVDFMTNLDKSLYKHHFLYEVPFLKAKGDGI